MIDNSENDYFYLVTNNQSTIQVYRGRFAPSPTGPLHFGSLVAAVGSYIDAKFNHGQWLVRIEDLDWQREIPGSASEILFALEHLGMEWDETVIYQSQRLEIYQDALDRLDQQDLIYPCICSRKEIADSSVMGLSGKIYPGTCRVKYSSTHQPHALRIKTNQNSIEFRDRIRGAYSQNLRRDVGDFVVRRADGIYAYQLAVVVDDAMQKITHVVRGSDLLDSTPRQIFLQRSLGYNMPQYMHLPVITNAIGEKLSKQTQATPIDLSNGQKLLVSALHFLGQAPPQELAENKLAGIWQWALENWRVEYIPQESHIRIC